MRKTRIMGVDVGFGGAYALLENLYPVEFGMFSKLGNDLYLEEFIDLAKTADIIAIEKAHAMPNQGVVSMFNYGSSFGQIIGVAKALQIPFVFIHPTTWKKALSSEHKGDKNISIEIVTRLYPNLFRDKKLKVLKKYHNICDAILIARHAAKQEVL